MASEAGVTSIGAPRVVVCQPTLFDAPAGGDSPPPHGSDGPIGPAQICVLASGSSGNCTVLRAGTGIQRRTILIDAGLGTRTTPRVLASLGVRLHEVSDVLLTHLDADHWREGWMRQRDFRAVVHLHRAHWPAAESLRAHRHRVRLYDAPFEPVPGLRVEPLVQHHDDHGVVAFRFRCAGGDVGFATDLGRVTPQLIDHLRGVRLLAIESNYCPRMQVQSDRPEFLKRRIMGGSGHLSNQQCAQAAAAIAPRTVVLLHLSRQCNTPELALAEHAGRDYQIAVSSQSGPTGWVAAD